MAVPGRSEPVLAPASYTFHLRSGSLPLELPIEWEAGNTLGDCSLNSYWSDRLGEPRRIVVLWLDRGFFSDATMA